MAGIVKSGQSVTAVFVTSSPATGAATSADSTPSGTLYVNGTANAASVTVTNVTTGRYKAAVTLPSLSAGDVVDLHVAATVGGVAGAGIVWSAIGDTQRISDSVAQTGDNYARIGAAGVGLTAVGDTSGTTTLLSRLSATRAGYLDNLSGGAVALSSSLTSAAADITTILGRVTAAVATATGLSAAQADLTTLLSRITGLLQTKAEADTAHGLLATAASVAALNNLSSAQAQAAAAAALTAYDPPTHAEMTAELATADDATLAAIAALNNLSSADAQAAAQAALVAYDAATGADVANVDLSPVQTVVDAIKAKTDNLPSDPADQSQVEAAITAAQGALAILIGALNDIAGSDVWAAMDDASADKLADHVLRRSWANAAASANGDTLDFRSLLGAVAKLVNRIEIVGSTLTVYENDDTTALGTQTLASDPAADPVTGATTN